MRILILGSGGREHVLAKKISESPLCSALLIAPGNAGTALCGENIAVSPLDFEGLKQVCIAHQIEMLVPGNEDPLVAGIYDFFKNDEALKHIMVAGPSKKGAQLEGSKDFSKVFMEKYGVPTAAYQSFTKQTIAEGKEFLATLDAPYVLKADGLAAGKGVLILDDLDAACNSLEEMLNGQFGESSSTVVVEEFLHGIEMSCFILTDGKDYVMLPEAKDYKRIGEGDKGLNTGGMGAISPVPFANTAFLEKVEQRIIQPTIEGLKKEAIDYCGFIFIGLMKVGPDPYVIEYNCRMGDPETEVVLHRVESDWVELFSAACNGKIKEVQLKVKAETAATVFMVSGGYPESFDKGYPISGLDAVQGSTVYHAGTKVVDGQIVTNGGRVLAITSTGKTIQEAIDKSMHNATLIHYDKKYYRKDIGQDLIHYNEQI